MKLYTKTGDDGTTGLCGGARIDKDSLRVEAYGTVDELNSFVGMSLVVCTDEQLTDILGVVQRRLFDLGAQLASGSPDTNQSRSKDLQADVAACISDRQINECEGHIDILCEYLEPLKHFVLPGGGELASRLHVARVVCRRAERLCIALFRQEPVSTAALVYLNRLSDLLFAAARRANQIEQISDIPWTT